MRVEEARGGFPEAEITEELRNYPDHMNYFFSVFWKRG
jgi:hypothetical protein